MGLICQVYYCPDLISQGPDLHPFMHSRSVNGAAKFQRAVVLFLIDIPFRKLLVKVLDLGQVVDHDVHVFRMIIDVILVVILRGEKRI
jgi:hypothetical protein